MAVGTAVGLSVLPPPQARPTTVMTRVVARTRIFFTSNPPLVSVYGNCGGTGPEPVYTKYMPCTIGVGVYHNGYSRST